MLLSPLACFLTSEGEAYDYSVPGSDCHDGDVGCSCTLGGNCDEGLRCESMLNTCVVKGDCAVGRRGCECTEGGTCDTGSTCKEGLCVSELPCNPEYTGAESCQCTMGGGCDSGLSCLSGICVDASSLASTSSEPGATDEGDVEGGTESVPEPEPETSTTGPARVPADESTSDGEDEAGSSDGAAVP